MKQIFFTISILALLVFSACDRIPADQRETPSEELPAWQGQYVLLEDFTGVRCVNCPAAAEQIEILKTVFGDKLIVVGLHPEITALNRPLNPSPDTNGNNPDLRNAQAEEFRSYYNIESLPTGIVMQKNNLLGKDEFYSQIVQYYARKAIANLNVSTSLTTDSTVNITANITFIDNYSGTGNTHLSLMIIEDSIIVAQITPEGTDRNYRQNHVLRGMATPVWGDQITGSTAAKNSTFNHSNSITLNKEWRRNYLYIVAILFDNETKEVIQVSQTKII
ncbi:MAG: Omp28 family outer membrane lipoprotein [Bacteroidales bacterium]|jgi:hypothetical protein|nr:Omp28 family outer membrane lipoprotein [Bacteroidales bacterium]